MIGCDIVSINFCSAVRLLGYAIVSINFVENSGDLFVNIIFYCIAPPQDSQNLALLEEAAAPQLGHTLGPVGAATAVDAVAAVAAAAAATGDETDADAGAGVGTDVVAGAGAGADVVTGACAGACAGAYGAATGCAAERALLSACFISSSWRSNSRHSLEVLSTLIVLSLNSISLK